ncbi:hypothetical protein E2C01_000541 [Portunus trituberculatus]|uniref:Uncharacterized protein n=1 Tax=Portunus trituberculatus TaxID=210409 RepID=A0A5B7CK06_PORTR|nr:hypothetical protein [Portunus trituberculatus]
MEVRGRHFNTGRTCFLAPPRPAKSPLPVWQAATQGPSRFRFGPLPDGPHHDPGVPYIPCGGARTSLARPVPPSDR